MVRKILTIISALVISLTLASCSGNYKISDYKKETTIEDFMTWTAAYEEMFMDNDFTRTTNQEGHKEETFYKYDKESSIINSDYLIDETIEVDIEKEIINTKRNTKSFVKEKGNKAAADSKYTTEVDTTLQKINDKHYTLDNKTLIGKELISFDLKYNALISTTFIIEELKEYNKYYKDDNVYTAVKEKDKEKYIYQIVVNKNSISFINSIESTFELELSPNRNRKTKESYKSNVTYTFKDIKLKEKDISKYTI